MVPNFDGWAFLGTFPKGDPDGVGSWLLHHDGEAMLLEVPPGLTPRAVRRRLTSLGCTLTHVTASHAHEDHLDRPAWRATRSAFPGADFMSPWAWNGEADGCDREMSLGGEPLWLTSAPKHSQGDTVVVFRGVAMTGDIELGTADSVNRELASRTRLASMAYLAGFQDRTGYRVHSIVSAHANDIRQGVDWRDLFGCHI